MKLNYTVRDAELWAAFSGDYNPIHFDLEYVRKIGGEQLSVHGMRAMLDMKRALSGALLSICAPQGFYCFSARMRQPVLCDTPYQLHVEHSGVQIVGKLSNIATGENCFSSKLTAAAPLALAAGCAEHALSYEQVMTLGQRFPGDALNAEQRWGFFDALLFQLLVKSPETLTTLNRTLPELAADTLLDIFAHVPVVQTHHETHFNAGLFATDKDAGPMSYAIQPMLIMGDRDSGFVLRAAIQANILQRPLMVTAVTLKTWPLAAH